MLYPVFRFFWCNARGGRLNLLPGMAVFALLFLIGVLLDRLKWENEQFERLSDEVERLKFRMEEPEQD